MTTGVHSGRWGLAGQEDTHKEVLPLPPFPEASRSLGMARSKGNQCGNQQGPFTSPPH